MKRATRLIRVADFFSGLHSWTKPLEHSDFPTRVFSIDNNPDYSDHTTVIKDFLQLTADEIIEHLGGVPDIVVASPPCTTFSIASCGHHWNAPDPVTDERVPKTQAAIIGLQLLEHCVKLIKELNPQCWFIENPRGLMRKMNVTQELGTRATVWYCQYGKTAGMLRAKPTDIWYQCPSWKPRPMCKNGNPNCSHERAARGAKTGTQGLKNNALRSIIPTELCEEIMLASIKELFS